MSDAIREAFEKWWLIEMGHRIHDQRSGDGYFPSDADASWEAWQAALQSQTAPAVPDVVGAALKIINQALALPAKPLPDPVAHSHEAYARALHEAFCAIRFKLMNARDALAAAPQPDHSPDAGKVVGDHYDLGVALSRHFDELRDSQTGHIAFDPCDSNDIDEVLAIIGAHLSPTPAAESREEIQAQALEKFADDMKAKSDGAMTVRLATIADWAETYARTEAARLRASQQEGGE